MQDASEFPIPLIYKEKLEKSMNSRQFFSILWQQYTYVTPLATRIYSLFSEANQGIINDSHFGVQKQKRILLNS